MIKWIMRKMKEAINFIIRLDKASTQNDNPETIEDIMDKMEEVKYWAYNIVNEKARIYFDSQKHYIDICEKDLKNMLDWIKMAKNNYYRD